MYIQKITMHYHIYFLVNICGKQNSKMVPKLPHYLMYMPYIISDTEYKEDLRMWWKTVFMIMLYCTVDFTKGKLSLVDFFSSGEPLDCYVPGERDWNLRKI